MCSTAVRHNDIVKVGSTLNCCKADYLWSDDWVSLELLCLCGEFSDRGCIWQQDTFERTSQESTKTINSVKQKIGKLNNL